jgi:hypothetical protein
MAAQLVAYFERASKEYGISARMKLAMLTTISSVRAQAEADSPENLKKFEEAFAQLKQLMKN